MATPLGVCDALGRGREQYKPAEAPTFRLRVCIGHGHMPIGPPRVQLLETDSDVDLSGLLAAAQSFGPFRGVLQLCRMRTALPPTGRLADYVNLSGMKTVTLDAVCSVQDL